MKTGTIAKRLFYFNADGAVDVVRAAHGYEIVQRATAGDRVFKHSHMNGLPTIKDATNYASDLYEQGKFA